MSRMNNVHDGATSCPGCVTCVNGGSSLCLSLRFDSSSCEMNCETNCCWNVFSSWDRKKKKYTHTFNLIIESLKADQSYRSMIIQLIIVLEFKKKKTAQICPECLGWLIEGGGGVIQLYCLVSHSLLSTKIKVLPFP